MKSLIALMVIVVLLLHRLGSGHFVKYPFLKDIIESPGFLQVALAADEEAQVDIRVPRKIEADEARYFRNFLQVAPMAVRIFNGQGKAPMVYHDRFVLLDFRCSRSEWKISLPLLLNVYFLHLFAMCSKVLDIKNHTIENLAESALFHVFVHNGQVLLAGNFNLLCLNCTDSLPTYTSLRLFTNMSPAASNFALYCHYPYICEQNQVKILKDIFLVKNASLNMIRISSLGEYSKAWILMMTYSSTLLYYPTFVRQGTFPAISIFSHFDSVETITFVKSPERLVKEAVLVLPFDIWVWALVFAGFFLSILACVFMVRVRPGRNTDFSSTALLFAASLVQQSYPLVVDVEKIYYFKVVFAIWCLAVLILTTGYKGVLISLLWNVPLDGEVVKPICCPISYQMTTRHCYLNIPKDSILGDITSSNPRTYFGAKCSDPNGKLRFGTDRKDVFHIYGSDFYNVYDNMNKVILMNYVEATDMLPQIVTGPEIRSSSRYKTALSDICNRAFEAALFERAKSFSKFTNNARRELGQKQPSLGQDPMTLANLRPCFFVWTVGIILSSLAFLVQYIAYHATKNSLQRDHNSTWLGSTPAFVDSS